MTRKNKLKEAVPWSSLDEERPVDQLGVESGQALPQW